MPTALFVQRDTRTTLVCRKMRATCTREEWDTPRWRQAAIEKAWAAATHAIKASGDLTLVTPAPVTLYRDRGGNVLYADIRLGPGAAPRFINPDGTALSVLMAPASAAVQRTTYAHWAEGPLVHIELTSESSSLSADDRLAIDQMPNSALRDHARRALSTAGRAGEARTAPSMRESVDFMIRGIFSMPDYTVLESKQSAEGSKLILDGGQTWDGRDNEQAPDSLLED